jgi:2-haloalkanoic acid dehalogenase type II
MTQKAPIEAIAFDCFGTLVEFGDEQFAQAYGEICRTQGIAIEGKVFFDKWMEIWRRLAQAARAAETAEQTAAVAAGAPAGHDLSGFSGSNSPSPLAEPVDIPPHPQHHAPAATAERPPTAIRHRGLYGPTPHFRPYSEEWPEHFGLCFEEFGVRGDSRAAYDQLIEIMGQARAYPESRRVVEALSRRYPVALMSNADDNFLLPPLARNGLTFAITLSSEQARAYKPHIAIFEQLSNAMGLAPENILYVGDSRFADITGAKNAGLHAAWINRRGANSGEDGGRRPDGPPVGGDGAGERQAARLPMLPPDFEVDTLDKLLDICG